MTALDAPMTRNAPVPNRPYSFQISKADMAPLVRDVLKLELDPRSVLNRTLGDASGRPGKASKDLKALAKDDRVQEAMAILARPSLIMDHREGGGAAMLNLFAACHAADIDARAFAVLMPSFEGAYLVNHFESPWVFLAWWLKYYASDPAEPMANYIPPPTGLEELVYILHAIDCYRRSSYVSQLSFTPTDTPSISVEAYGATLKQSIASADLRWLLPSFLGLVPNLDLSAFSADPAFMEPLAVLDFLLPGKAVSSDEGVLAFGEAGRLMGVEFYRSWFKSVGFELTIRHDSHWHILHRGFLAPTGLANHLILAEQEREGGLHFNHQAMPLAALETKMARLLSDALKWTPKQSVPLGEPVGKTDEMTCSSCGSPLMPGQKFCPNCGTRVQQALQT